MIGRTFIRRDRRGWRLVLVGTLFSGVCASCSSPPVVYQGIDKTFVNNMARIAVMPFGPFVPLPPVPRTGTLTGTGANAGGGLGATGGVATGAGAGASAGATGAAAVFQNLVGATNRTSTPDSALLTAAVESELVRVGKNQFDVIEREEFLLLLREKQINDTDFKDQSALNLMELGEKVGVDAYLTGDIDGLIYDQSADRWILTARTKLIDTRSAKVWYNEIFVAHGRNRPEAVRRWAKLVGLAMTEEEFNVPFSY